MTNLTDVQRDDEVMGGTPVFTGTRVAVKTFFDYLERSSLNEFLLDFPTVKRKQALGVLESARAAFNE